MKAKSVIEGAGRNQTSGWNARRKSISAILRTAYAVHVRDLLTRRAVKRILG